MLIALPHLMAAAWAQVTGADATGGGRGDPCARTAGIRTQAHADGAAQSSLDEGAANEPHPRTAERHLLLRAEQGPGSPVRD